jgi:uncharacterized delta-60 repeat protein
VSRNNIARLNADGSLDNGFLNGLSGVGAPPGYFPYVHSLAAQSDGKALLVGNFTTVNDVSRNNIARLNADGTLDSGFQNGLSGIRADPAISYYPSVSSLAAQSDGKVLIGGHFHLVNGVSRTNIARLNADGSLDSDFQNGLSGADGNVRFVAVQSDGKVLIGGNFSIVNGVGRKAIARLNADGSLDRGFLNGLSGVGNPFDGSSVNSVAVQSDGKVLIGGSFYRVNGEDRVGIARLNADGKLDSGFQEGLSGVGGDAYSVDSIALQSDGKVLIGGNFYRVNGVQARSFARLWGSSDIPPLVRSINRSGGDVNLIWESIPHRTYRVQYNGNPSGNNWTDLAGDISATGATASKTDTTLSDAGQRFYRVMLLP